MTFSKEWDQQEVQGTSCKNSSSSSWCIWMMVLFKEEEEEADGEAKWDDERWGRSSKGRGEVQGQGIGKSLVEEGVEIDVWKRKTNSWNIISLEMKIEWECKPNTL